MNQYYFNMLGLRITLRTPYPVTLSERLKPFLSAPHKAADCTIRLELCETLPQPENGDWHGLECYVQKENALQIFHCLKQFAAPFAVTTMAQKGDIHIAVLSGYADYFTGTSGIFNRIGFENLLLQYDGLLLHASLIDHAGNGIAFTGPSGVGKSTQAELWQDCQGAKLLNGDRAALRKEHSGWNAYGSPYAGTSGIYRNESAPLRAIVVLRQAKENHLRKLSGREALTAVWPEISARRDDAAFVAEASKLCAQLLSDVQVYLLECLPEESAVACLKEGLDL